MKATITSAHDFVNQTRRISAVCGVLLLLTLALTREDDRAARLAVVALAAIGFATLCGWLQLLIQPRFRPAIPDPKTMWSRGQWMLAATVVAATVGLAVQTWFHPGTSVAFGDITPPDGTAWLERVFEPWIWSGSNLGEPSQMTLQVPWAVVVGVVHWLGGSADLSQRIWYTTLAAGAALGAFALIAALRMGPLAAMVGAALYVFNPYVVAWVNVNPVFLAGLALLAAMPAALIAAGVGRLSMRWAAALIALAAPVLGYVNSNPPLVGMILAALVIAPFVAGWVFGRDAAIRSLRALGLAIPLLVGASAYWIVPAIIHLPVVANDQLANLSSWSWTEIRATIRNALWLNTIWAWNYPEYYPYASAYDALPWSIIRFLLPAIAFSGLALGYDTHAADMLRRDRALRLIVVAATGASVIIFLSTGTNSPGNLVFDTLYSLPLGWLLREPGRFLMFAALTYAVLVAVVVDDLYNNHSVAELAFWRHLFTRGLRFGIVPVVLAASITLGFPLYTGAIVPDKRPLLPPGHAMVPGYWQEMARVVDAQTTQGSVLVMPPDDYYQMPYSWNYYGSDGFIVNMFRRHVVIPNGQGYSPASGELMTAVTLTAESILQHDWAQTEALVRTIDTPLILVRRDIETPYQNRAILVPKDLSLALGAAPNFVLVRSIGALDLYALRDPTDGPQTISTPVTTTTQLPDLRLLPLLPRNSALVLSQSRSGISSASAVPPLEAWQDTGNVLLWQDSVPPTWSYQLADLSAKTIFPLDQPGSVTSGQTGIRVDYTPNASGSTVAISVPRRMALPNGDFSRGSWGPVGDCSGVSPASSAVVNAEVVTGAAPGGVTALRLSASAGSACESQPLDWTGGPVVLSLLVNHVTGNQARICVWESGPNRCATISSLPSTSGWSVYRASITPDPGTHELVLFLYADSGGIATINEYADPRAFEVSALPDLYILATPIGPALPTLRLVVLRNSYSTQWVDNGQHVVVNGILNGWLQTSGSQLSIPRYQPATIVKGSQWLSLAVWLFALVALVSQMGSRLARHTPFVDWLGRLRSQSLSDKSDKVA